MSTTGLVGGAVSWAGYSAFLKSRRYQENGHHVPLCTTMPRPFELPVCCTERRSRSAITCFTSGAVWV